MKTKEQIKWDLEGAHASVEEASALISMFGIEDPGVRNAAVRALERITDAQNALVDNRWVLSEPELVAESLALTERLAALRIPL